MNKVTRMRRIRSTLIIVGGTLMLLAAFFSSHFWISVPSWIRG